MVVPRELVTFTVPDFVFVVCCLYYEAISPQPAATNFAIIRPKY